MKSSTQHCNIQHVEHPTRSYQAFKEAGEYRLQQREKSAIEIAPKVTEMVDLTQGP